MRQVIITILSLTTLSCLAQNTWTIQVWNKNGGLHQFRTDDVDSITFVQNSSARNWEDILTFPSQVQINHVNSTSECRSPYLTGWLYTAIGDSCFSGYAIDFKADYLPQQTYCSLATFRLDTSSLSSKYVTVNNGDHYYSYSGFQRSIQPNHPEYNGILSIWDTYCTDKSGKTDTLKAALIYPEGKEAVRYNHEGDGVSYHPEYNWKPGNWYRMLVQCAEKQNGNTQLEFWVADLDTKTWTKLCVFDMGAPNLQFKGNTAVFLEDWLTETAGEIRSLEIKNARIYKRSLGKWVNIYSGYFNDRDSGQSICYSGSYQYGSDDTTFWMITTGVLNCAEPQDGMKLSVNFSEEGSPLTLK